MELPLFRSRPQSTQSSKDRIANLRTQVSSFFNGRSIIQSRPSTPGDAAPKSPVPRLGLQILSGNRINIPPIDTRVPPATRSPSSTCSLIDPTSSPDGSIRPLPPTAFQRHEHTPARPDRVRPSRSRRTTRRASPEEELLLTLVGSQRQRQRKHKKAKAKRIFSPLTIKNRAIRRKAVGCMLSGGFLTMVLAIYLALAISNSAAGQEFHVLLILVILILTIFFCHSLIRLCMLIFRPRKIEDRTGRVPSRVGPLGFAQPEQPIPVVLARDEEIAIGEEENEREKLTVRPPPPAYGLWRSSVRVNPNLIHWQRVNNQNARRRDANREGDGQERLGTANRPPSYASEDGVEYVVEAQPRYTTYEQQLLIHPSGRGRITGISTR